MSWREDYGDEAAIQAYADNFGLDVEDVEESDFLDAFRGEYASIEEWAEEFLRDTGQLDGLGMLEQYFDYESYASDCETGGDIWTADAPHGRVFIFDNL